MKSEKNINKDIWERIPDTTPEDLARSVLGVDEKKKPMKQYYLDADNRVHEKDKCIATRTVRELIPLPKSPSIGKAIDTARLDKRDAIIRPCMTCLGAKN